MSFTDDDLRWLKRSIDDYVNDSARKMFVVDVFDLIKLIARVEAAEMFVRSSTAAYPWLKETTMGAAGQRFDEWSKAAGK